MKELKTFLSKKGFLYTLYGKCNPISGLRFEGTVEVTKNGNFVNQFGIFSDGVNVYDYDGVYSLSIGAIRALKAMGFNTSDVE